MQNSALPPPPMVAQSKSIDNTTRRRTPRLRTSKCNAFRATTIALNRVLSNAPPFAHTDSGSHSIATPHALQPCDEEE